MQVRDDALPLLKSMRVDYLRVARGDLRAVAALRPEQAEQVKKKPSAQSRGSRSCAAAAAAASLYAHALPLPSHGKCGRRPHGKCGRRHQSSGSGNAGHVRAARARERRRT